MHDHRGADSADKTVIVEICIIELQNRKKMRRKSLQMLWYRHICTQHHRSPFAVDRTSDTPRASAKHSFIFDCTLNLDQSSK